MFKYLFKRDTLLATVMVFAVMGLLALIPINTHVLDPIKLALQDFDYNDLTYARMGKNRHTDMDTNIVIVNVGAADRRSIGVMMQKINEAKPKALGVDVLFHEPKGIEQDSLISSLVVSGSRTVMAYNLQAEGDFFKPEGFLFKEASQKGYANFVGEEGGVIRYFAPAIQAGGENHLSFAASVVKVADQNKFNQLLQRDYKAEVIHYTRTPDKYVVVDGEALLSGQENSSVLTNKIVLLGFVAPDETSIEDKHFTPMNRNAIGKSTPDMEGVFIHANIISMILGNNFINKTPTWLIWFIAFILCWVHMSLFIRYFLDHHIWFHLAAKMAQIISAVLFVYLGLLLYYKGDLKINLTPTLVAIILAVDVLYFYEAICTWLHRKYGYTSLFSHSKHHH